MTVMRSCFYIPGSSEKMIGKAPRIPADIITLDLEDSVSAAEKPRARQLVRDSLETAGASGADVYVRVHHWVTRLTDTDLDAVVHPGLSGVVLAKCGHPDDVRRLDRTLGELEHRRNLASGSVVIQLLIETASGAVHAYESAKASPRVNALIFGALDYCREMRIALTADGIHHARAHTALAARAARCIAIDYPFANFSDRDGFEETARAGRALGYEGRVLIHPDQIEPCHHIYTPSEDDIAEAHRIIDAVEAEGLAKGSGAIGYQGRMIDTPDYEAAKALVATATEISERDRTRDGSA